MMKELISVSTTTDDHMLKSLSCMIYNFQNIKELKKKIHHWIEYFELTLNIYFYEENEC